MLENNLQISIRELERCIILDLQGDLNIQAEEKLLRLRDWEKGLVPGKNHLLLNFTDVQYINSYGIAILIRLARACAKGGCPITAYGLTYHYAKLLRMVGLTNLLRICTDQEEALRTV
ncbi:MULTISPECIES: STAS domain-containing protein [unclassified Paenibacillus]|uniref:STAS domain-containing protein n=1 Tax=unclassified Paenibacillus TaxID=185978 RepID=UPI002F40AE5B